MQNNINDLIQTLQDGEKLVREKIRKSAIIALMLQNIRLEMENRGRDNTVIFTDSNGFPELYFIFGYKVIPLKLNLDNLSEEQILSDQFTQAIVEGVLHHAQNYELKLEYYSFRIEQFVNRIDSVDENCTAEYVKRISTDFIEDILVDIVSTFDSLKRKIYYVENE
jgi:hypothetical protein